MATIEVDGKTYNTQDSCQVPLCPHKSAARVIEPEDPNTKRRDICFKHAKAMVRVYKEHVEIIATWNGFTMEDFDD